MNFDELNFGCYVEMLSIEYGIDWISNYIIPIMMQRQYEYTWELDSTELNIFLKSDIDSSLYSPNFNGDCGCIVLIPYGWGYMDETEGYLFAKIKLMKLPFGIKSIHIESEFIIRSDAASIGWKYKKKCDIQKPGLVDMDRRIKSEK